MGNEFTRKYRSRENMTLTVHSTSPKHTCSPLTFEEILVKFDISMPEAIKRSSQKDRNIQKCRLIHGDKKRFVKKEERVFNSLIKKLPKLKKCKDNELIQCSQKLYERRKQNVLGMH